MTAAAVGLAAILGLAAPPEQFRYSRPIEARPGWARLVLPDDVLNACRPGLADLRIRDAGGREIPFAVEQDRTASSRRFPIQNLETVDKTETIGIIDRGPSPGFAEALTFEVAGADFLKPVRVQSSEDRSSWADVSKGSIFGADGARMLTLRLPGNDRRYLRFRLDDRNSDPIRPEAVLVRARIGEAEGDPQDRPVEIKPVASEVDRVSRYSAVLPAANLNLTGLRFHAADPAFSRPTRVYERVFFRDEICRRLVAEGRLARAPGAGGDLDLPVAGIAGRNLDIEIENGDSPALTGLRVTALARDRALRFFVPEGAGLRILYGSPSARAPQYDLGRAFEGGTPAAAAEAALGPALAADVAASPVSSPPRAPLAGPEQWASRRPILLPSAAGVAYLDFYDLPGGVADLRIVDGSDRQVPYLVEQGSHEHRRKVRLDVSNVGTHTLAKIEAPGDDLRSADAIELSASGPDYFSRDVRVQEEERDPRGVSGIRALGAARWERQPGEERPVLRIPIARPSAARSVLQIEIENGDNVPVEVAEASILSSATRIDFVFTPGEELFLLSGNPQARPPTYDLDLLAGVILASPADAARLGPAPQARPSRTPVPRWFWIAIVIAVLLLVFQLARTLKKTA